MGNLQKLQSMKSMKEPSAIYKIRLFALALRERERSDANSVVERQTLMRRKKQEKDQRWQWQKTGSN